MPDALQGVDLGVVGALPDRAARSVGIGDAGHQCIARSYGLYIFDASKRIAPGRLPALHRPLDRAAASGPPVGCCRSCGPCALRGCAVFCGRLRPGRTIPCARRVATAPAPAGHRPLASRSSLALSNISLHHSSHNTTTGGLNASYRRPAGRPSCRRTPTRQPHRHPREEVDTKFSQPGVEDDFLEWTWLVEGRRQATSRSPAHLVATGPKSAIVRYLTALLARATSTSAPGSMRRISSARRHRS